MIDVNKIEGVTSCAWGGALPRCVAWAENTGRTNWAKARSFGWEGGLRRSRSPANCRKLVRTRVGISEIAHTYRPSGLRLRLGISCACQVVAMSHAEEGESSKKDQYSGDYGANDDPRMYFTRCDLGSIQSLGPSINSIQRPGVQCWVSQIVQMQVAILLRVRS